MDAAAGIYGLEILNCPGPEFLAQGPRCAGKCRRLTEKNLSAADALLCFKRRGKAQDSRQGQGKKAQGGTQGLAGSA